MTSPLDHANAGDRIDDLATLTARCGAPGETSVCKEFDHLHRHYRAIIGSAPLAALATAGLDASPCGNASGLRVGQDEHTLLLPDRRG